MMAHQHSQRSSLIGMAPSGENRRPSQACARAFERSRGLSSGIEDDLLEAGFYPFLRNRDKPYSTDQPLVPARMNRRTPQAPLGLIPQPKENYAVSRHRGCVLLTGQVQILMTPQIPHAWRGRLQAQVRPRDGDLRCFASAIE